MRILAGSLKGQKILIPKGIRVTRPLVRKVMFDILPDLTGCLFLDICAGSGSVGLEAISRGAQRVWFVEKNPRVARVLRSNIQRLEIGERVRVVIGDAVKVLKTLKSDFDIVHLDPPYRSRLLSTLLPEIARLNLLRTDGIVVVESSRRTTFSSAPFQVEKRRIIGETVLSFLSRS
ncbi:16S rRNA (guanine(966)-N(2))-methyltransferase RsmD [candidate division WOR-3 bacterium]|uniref:16S rRNA (Guanine(966)-N(2))-methyltransferase RsmD n=1 Tax=candidate division WOR-3 bacterium TaxID=2052148 RepID=A0A660SJM5_UNCW3|nr:MAG: 16S rRNA (guanine(966)-N(2))-methyltransferase RsmD [candidate division WOR-3 bacterium]